MDWRQLLDFMNPEEARALLDDRGAGEYARALGGAGLPLAGAFTDPGHLDVLATVLLRVAGTPEAVLEGEPQE